MANPLRYTILFVVLPALSGCVAVWGGSYQVDSQTKDAYSIQYDTNFIDEASITAMAQEHCAQYSRMAVLQSHDTNMLNISTASYACREKTGAQR